MLHTYEWLKDIIRWLKDRDIKVLIKTPNINLINKIIKKLPTDGAVTTKKCKHKNIYLHLNINEQFNPKYLSYKGIIFSKLHQIREWYNYIDKNKIIIEHNECYEHGWEDCCDGVMFNYSNIQNIDKIIKSIKENSCQYKNYHGNIYIEVSDIIFFTEKLLHYRLCITIKKLFKNNQIFLVLNLQYNY